MARVIVTGPAKRDIRHILSDLAARAGHRIAERYGADFKATYHRLSSFPESGSPRPTLGANIRIALVLPYIVIYENTNDGSVAVLRVLHGKRDITRDLIR